MSPRWPVVLMLLVVSGSPAAARPLRNHFALARTERKLAGTVHDFTHNHGSDNRIWSSALGKPRDLYVYLPPGFDPCQRYPLVMLMHGFAQDEVSILLDVLPALDAAIVAGKLPPAIIAAPDGSINGRACLYNAGSFYINSRAGAFEDYLMVDVWNFLHEHYPIRPEREAHVLAGASMGGGAAFIHGIRHRDRVGVAVGIFPPLNSRWLDCHCRYRGNFDPSCWGWRTDFSRRKEVVARFYGIFAIRLGQVVKPLYGNDPNTAELVARENPIEMLDAHCLREGELAMFVAYGKKDQFNLDAQVESFLYAAHQRGLTVASVCDPDGKHDVRTALRLVPYAVEWLAPRLAPYSPGFACPAGP